MGSFFILGTAIIYPLPGASMVSKHVELVSEPDQMVHRTVKKWGKVKAVLFHASHFEWHKSTFHVCQNINQTTESTGPGPLYLWYEENREISEEFMATCRELPEEEEAGWFCFKIFTKLFY